MIIGVVTIGSILTLLAINGLKIWNLYHKGEKYNWIWSVVLLGLALLAFGALFNNYLITFYAANQEVLLTPDFFEASNYLLFGIVTVLMALAFTLSEIMIFLGVIVFHSLEGPTERAMPERRGNPYIGKLF